VEYLVLATVPGKSPAEGTRGNACASRLERKPPARVPAQRRVSDFPAAASNPRQPSPLESFVSFMPLHDKFGRTISDLRIAITDRCNYRCVYCRTGNDGAQYADLNLDDYLRMVRVLVSLGIEKVRVTGGEPLLRKGVVEFIRELSRFRTPGGKKLDLALTTNGHLLEDLAEPLKDAGLNRITVSMDAVDSEKFARITRVPNGFRRVLAGIRAAKRAGLDPVKVNCVLLRGFNEDQIVEFAKF
jgi:cyclic pyranopterin phosphate synthase